MLSSTWIPNLGLMLLSCIAMFGLYLSVVRMKMERYGKLYLELDHRESRKDWWDRKKFLEKASPYWATSNWVAMAVLCGMVYYIPNASQYTPLLQSIIVVGFLLCYFSEPVQRIWKGIVGLFKKPANPSHDRSWILHCNISYIRNSFRKNHPYFYGFFILAERLLICNVVGHRWKSWEAVKYGDFGNARMCKACLVNHSVSKYGELFHETHTGAWNRIENPDSVFRRKYIKREE